ncbi:MAG: hypothetical protein AAFX06_29695, partial [Planctomycetota bacterium]
MPFFTSQIASAILSKPNAFISNADMLAANGGSLAEAGKPNAAEFQAAVTAASLTNVVAYYTGDNTDNHLSATLTANVDSEGEATLNGGPDPNSHDGVVQDNAISANTTAIANETTRATTAEVALQSLIDNLDPDKEIGTLDATSFDASADLPAANKAEYLRVNVAGSITINSVAYDVTVNSVVRCNADGTTANDETAWTVLIAGSGGNFDKVLEQGGALTASRSIDGGGSNLTFLNLASLLVSVADYVLDVTGAWRVNASEYFFGNGSGGNLPSDKASESTVFLVLDISTGKVLKTSSSLVANVVDASASAQNVPLPEPTGSGAVVFLSVADATNSVTVSTTNGTVGNVASYLASNHGDADLILTDKVAGNWSVSVIGQPGTVERTIVPVTLTDITHVSGGSLTYDGDSNTASQEISLVSAEYYDEGNTRVITLQYWEQAENEVVLDLGSLVPAGASFDYGVGNAVDGSSFGGGASFLRKTGQPSRVGINRNDAIDGDHQWLTKLFIDLSGSDVGGQVVLAGAVKPEELAIMAFSSATDQNDKAVGDVTIENATRISGGITFDASTNVFTLPQSNKPYYCDAEIAWDWDDGTGASDFSGTTSVEWVDAATNAAIGTHRGTASLSEQSSDNPDLYNGTARTWIDASAGPVNVKLRATSAGVNIDIINITGLIQQFSSGEFALPDALPVGDLAKDSVTLSADYGVTVGYSDVNELTLTVPNDGDYVIAATLNVEGSGDDVFSSHVLTDGSNNEIGTPQFVKAHDLSTGDFTQFPITLYFELEGAVAGDVVKVRSQKSDTNDTVTVKEGSRLFYRQVATKTVINTTDVPVNDQAANGWRDIGDVREQWGTFNSSQANGGTINLPMPFADDQYFVNPVPSASSSSN